MVGVLTSQRINAALVEMRKRNRPEGERNSKFAEAANITDQQVKQVMKGGGLTLPVMEKWVKACGFAALSQFIVQLEMDSTPRLEAVDSKKPPATESPPRKKVSGQRGQRA